MATPKAPQREADAGANPLIFGTPRRLSAAEIVDNAQRHTLDVDELFEGRELDRTRLFVSEEMTPLWFTPIYSEFTEEQRLVYNHLTATHINEMTLFLEDAIADDTLSRILAVVPLEPTLRACVESFLEEERKHKEMFRRLNRLCDPEDYRDRDYRFVRSNSVAAKMIGRFARRAERWPFLIVLILLMEEHAIQISRAVLVSARKSTGVDPLFTAAHRLHVTEEVRHVQTDMLLLEEAMDRIGPVRRRANALILRQTMARWSGPGRATDRLARELVRRCPELAAMEPRIRRAHADVQSDPAFRRSMFSRVDSPLAFETLNAFEDIAGPLRALGLFD